MNRSRRKGGRLRSLAALGVVGLLAGCAQVPPKPYRLETTEPAPVSAQDSATRTGTASAESLASPVKPLLAARLTPTQPDQLASIAYSDAAALRRSLGKAVDRRSSLQLAQGNIEWAVVDDYKRPLPLVRSRRGDGAFQLGATEGTPYCLVFRNLGDRNYEIVATVDGQDVLGGTPGSPNNRGYLLAARDELVIKGFRKGRDEVEPFRFASPNRVHAGKPVAGDVPGAGVLGVAIYRLGGLDVPAPQRTALQERQVDLFPIGVRPGGASSPRNRD